MLAALSSVLRSMVIFRPSSVRLAEGPLTLSVALVTDKEMPSSLSSVLIDEIGRDSGALWPAAAMPLASTVTCSPAMSMFCTSVEPMTLPVVPSEVAVAVEVTLPIVMKPPRMEMPPSVALAWALALALGASDDDVADMVPIPMMAEEPANGLLELDGAVRVGSAPLEPAVDGVVADSGGGRVPVGGARRVHVHPGLVGRRGVGGLRVLTRGLDRPDGGGRQGNARCQQRELGADVRDDLTGIEARCGGVAGRAVVVARGRVALVELERGCRRNREVGLLVLGRDGLGQRGQCEAAQRGVGPGRPVGKGGRQQPRSTGDEQEGGGAEEGRPTPGRGGGADATPHAAAPPR